MHVDAALVRVDDLLGDVEAEPEALVAARFALRRARNGSKMCGSTSAAMLPPLVDREDDDLGLRAVEADAGPARRPRRAAARCRSGWTRPAPAGRCPSRR